MVKISAGLRWNSEPIPLPISDRKTGKRQDVWAIYDLAACFNLETGDTFRALLGELSDQDRRQARAINRLIRDWTTEHPRGDTECETDAEYAAYDQARETYEAMLASLRKDHAPIRRAINLRMIAEIIVAIGGKDVEDAPDPKDADSWADWPDMLLDWLTESGLAEAKAGIRSKKSSG